MKKDNSNLNDTQQEKLIQKTLRTGGFLFPETPEEVVEFEKQFGNTDILLPEELRDPTFLNSKREKIIKKSPIAIKGNLAMAARDGSKLPDELLEEMKKHRERAKMNKKK